MRPSSCLYVVLGLLALAALAGPAAASELYVVVDKTVPPGEPLPLTLRTDAEREVVVRAWRLESEQELLRSGVPLDRGETLAWLDPERGSAAERERRLKRSVIIEPALGPTSYRTPKTGSRTVDLNLGRAGLYLIRASSGGAHAYATALVSSAAMIVKRSANELLVWIVDRTTGEPMSGVGVRVGLTGGAFMDAMTDAEGRASFEGRFPDSTRVVAGSPFSALAFGQVGWHSPVSADRRVYLHTHQPAYRPGERVEVRGIVRALENGQLRRDPAVREASVRLVAPGDREMGKATVPVSSDMGTFGGGFDLPADAPTGDWVVIADIAGHAYEAPLKVDAYRKPAFEVTVAGARPRVLVGTDTQFEVRAEWYDGGPLANAAVKWQILYHRVDRELFGEDELVRLFFGSERDAYRPETVATGEGTLDGKGRLEVPVTVGADRPDGFLSLRATITGADRVAVAGSGRIAVSSAPLAVALQADRHLYGPEEVARVTVRVELADGKPGASRDGVLTVALAPEVAPGTPPEEKWLHTLPFRTNDMGVATVQAPLAGAGRYALSVAVPRTDDEPAGAPAHARLHVWAVGERSAPGHLGAGIEVIADRDHYSVGDTARLLVMSGRAPRPILATLEADGIIAQAVLTPGEVAPIWSVPLTEAHVPNVHATFSMVDHGRLLTATRVLRIPPRTRLLTTRVRPDAADLEPGATSGVTIEVADSEGQAVAGAEVSVAVVDDALFAIHADPAAPVEAFFHPPRRNGVGTEAVLDWTSVGWAVSKRPKAKAGPTAATEAMPVPTTPAPARAPAARPSAGAISGGEDGGAPADAEVPEAVEEMDFEEAEADGSPRFAEPAEEAEGYANGRDVAKKGKAGSRAAVRVREDFRTAIHWEAALRTKADGRARVEPFRYGDSLTRWRVTAQSVDADTRVGTGTAFVRTRRKVSSRITLPRFLRAGDAVAVPLVLRNLTDKEVGAQWRLTAEARNWDKLGAFTLGARATKVVEHEFASEEPGTVAFLARLTTDVGADAARRQLPVLPRGIRKVEGFNLFAQQGEGRITIPVPKNAEPGTIECQVRVEPAYVHAMLGALPYLLEYPYGCTEQTMNRFVPLLAAAEAGKALGGKPIGDATSDLPAMIEAGLKRLTALQHADGGFGWWERDGTDVAMTALVVRGLSRLLAVHPDHVVAKAMRDRAAEALKKIMAERLPSLDPATRASLILALSAAGRLEGVRLNRTRTESPLTAALLLRAFVALKHTESVAAVRGHLDDIARREGDLLWWSPRPLALAEESPTRWQDDAVETTAMVLLALLEADVRPQVLEGGARWLLTQRRGGDRWRSTRDTGAAVEFLAAYVRATGDLGGGRQIELDADGETMWRRSDAKKGTGLAATTVRLPESTLRPNRSIELTLRCPEGAASASIALHYHETGPAISAASNGMEVKRRFYRLDPGEANGQVTWSRLPVTETLPSGALVECEVEVTAPQPREYVMVTSPHAASFEPAREVGMVIAGRAPAFEARKEAYDDRTMFFVARLPEGRSIFRHLLRATHVGTFTALPAQAELMYFPEVRGNGSGELWQVTAAGPTGEDSREGGR